jgi:hypothetical protein
VLLGVSALAGCASTTSGAPTDAPGLTLRVEDRDTAAGRYMVYEVYALMADGVLQVGSGAVAQEGLTDATVPLSSADLAEIRSVVEAARWASEPPDRTGDGPRRLAVRLQIDGVSRRFEIWADGRVFDPADLGVLTLLESMARRRFGTVLDGLPRGK